MTTVNNTILLSELDDDLTETMYSSFYSFITGDFVREDVLNDMTITETQEAELLNFQKQIKDIMIRIRMCYTCLRRNVKGCKTDAYTFGDTQETVESKLQKAFLLSEPTFINAEIERELAYQEKANELNDETIKAYTYLQNDGTYLTVQDCPD